VTDARAALTRFVGQARMAGTPEYPNSFTCFFTSAMVRSGSTYTRLHDTCFGAYSEQMRWISGAEEFDIGQSEVTKKRTEAFPSGLSGERKTPSTSCMVEDAPSAEVEHST